MNLRGQGSRRRMNTWIVTAKTDPTTMCSCFRVYGQNRRQMRASFGTVSAMFLARAMLRELLGRSARQPRESKNPIDDGVPGEVLQRAAPGRRAEARPQFG